MPQAPHYTNELFFTSTIDGKKFFSPSRQPVALTVFSTLTLDMLSLML